MPLNSIFGWFMKKRVHQIDLFKRYPVEVQNEWFLKLIKLGGDTKFGKYYNFSKITSIIDFQQMVPLQDYNSIKPWIDDSIDGKQNILWSGETKWFAKSSGTTSDRSKFIPVTKDSLEDCHYKGGKDLLALYYTNFPESKIYKGKHLVVGGSASYSPLRSDSYTGDLSAIILENLPWWAEIKRTPSKDIALMDNWEEKIVRLAESTCQEDVYSISGVPSWTLVLMNKVLEVTGKSNICEVWPNLELYMHGGVSFEPYRSEFNRLIPSSKMNYIESYNASEGFFGIQDEVDGDLLLMLDYGIFFEFIPMDDYDGINSKNVVCLDKVELDKNYAVVISTNGGLWRYIIGDTVKFTNKFPFRVKVSGRTKHFINVFGEEVIIENTDRAISQACQKTNSAISDYTVCPVFMDGNNQGAHEWLIEFVQMPQDEHEFLQILDQELRNINSDYDAKRTANLTLSLPLMTVAPKDTFNNWLKDEGKLGGQHKVPRLSNSRDTLEKIKSSIKGLVFD